MTNQLKIFRATRAAAVLLSLNAFALSPLPARAHISPLSESIMRPEESPKKALTNMVSAIPVPGTTQLQIGYKTLTQNVDLENYAVRGKKLSDIVGKFTGTKTYPATVNGARAVIILMTENRPIFILEGKEGVISFFVPGMNMSLKGGRITQTSFVGNGFVDGNFPGLAMVSDEGVLYVDSKLREALAGHTPETQRLFENGKFYVESARKGKLNLLVIAKDSLFNISMDAPK